jgi:hypothetical protein
MNSAAQKKGIFYAGPCSFTQWREMAERISGVVRIDYNMLPHLRDVLGKCHSIDAYMVCPAYHAFTGRHGLWAYTKNGSIVLFACNPDVPEQIMFYPQIGAPFPSLAFDLMHGLPVPPKGYQFSRMDSEQARFLAASMNKESARFFCEVATEKRLDWAFPSHTISVERVLNPAGRKFKSFRQHLAAVDKEAFRVEALDPSADASELMNVIIKWAQKKIEICDPAELIETYASFVKCMQCQPLSIKGIKIYHCEQLMAFEAWAVLPGSRKVANSLAGFNKSKMRGFSEFQIHALCKTLHKQGVEEICLGGSETAGLDAFKRKLNPVRSLDLSTIKVRTLQN